MGEKMLKNIDKTLFYTVILLSLFGIVMIYSSSNILANLKFGNSYKFVINQGFFLIIGIALMIIFSKINTDFYYKNSNKILFVCVFLLILVLIPGIGTVRNGSRSWFGLFGFGIQPSEIAKLGIIIFASKYLSKNDKDKKNTNSYIFPILIVTIFIFLLILLEPDFGTGLVLVVGVVGIIFITGTKLKIFLKLGIVGLLSIIGLIIMAPYRLKRITSFLNPWSDPLGSGFQIIQSLYAIGPGGLFGLGFLNSHQKHFYLPEPQTDFIFSIICEEFGIVGAIIITSLFIIIFYRCIKISLKETNLFKKYLSFGLSFMLIFQSLLNTSIIIGLLPVTGITLPFVSYGGTSLIISFIFMGIVLNISRNKN